LRGVGGHTRRRFERREILALAARICSRSQRDLIEEPWQKPLGQHQFRQHWQFYIVAEAASIGRPLPQQQGIEESFDLARIAAGSARQGGTDLIA
jgi:hypothetical protein